MARPVALSAAAGFALAIGSFGVGCGDAAAPDEAQHLVAAPPSAGLCDPPRRYDAALRQGRCADVPTETGIWAASSLFPDAPAVVRRTACGYAWFAFEEDAPPDEDALRRVPGLVVLGPNCTGVTEPSDDAAAVEIEGLDAFTHVGAAGCDVCGLLKGDRLYVTMPPARIHSKQLALRLVGGGERYFQLVVPPGAGQSFVVTVPPPPPGARYVEGRVAIQ